MAKNKVYAIKKGNKVENLIVESWAECSKLVLGYNAKYESFKTREEAEIYLGLKKEEPIKDILEDTPKNKIDKNKLSEIENILNNKNDKSKFIKKKKKLKNIETLSVDIPKDLYNIFIEKCTSLNMKEDIVIKNMIKEWLL